MSQKIEVNLLPPSQETKAIKRQIIEEIDFEKLLMVGLTLITIGLLGIFFYAIYSTIMLWYIGLIYVSPLFVFLVMEVNWLYKHRDIKPERIELTNSKEGDN